MQELNLNTNDVVLVEDRARGIKTARELGIYTIYIPYEYKIHSQVHPLLKSEEIIADVNIQNLSEVFPIIESLKNKK